MKDMYTLESKMYKLFFSIKDMLESSYFSRAAQVSVAVADLIGEAFNYVVSGICAGKVVEPLSATDLSNLICTKAELLLKDAYRANKRTHGLRSVRASIWLDESFDDGERSRSLLDRLSDWESKKEAETREREGNAVRSTFEAVIKKMGMNARNQDIARELMIEGRKPEEVADIFGVARNNCDAIAFRVRKALKKMGPELFRKFYEEAA